MKDLRGKTAVITGAASGIGLAMARRVAAAGMNVVLSDIEEPVLDEAVATVGEVAEANGAEAVGVVTDVTDEAAVQSLADQSIGRFGAVNLLCNNAGVSGSQLFSGPGHVAVKEWRWVIEVNLFGVIHGHAAFLPHLMEHGDGHIVNTASMAGHMPGHSAYMASKWAVVGITEGLYGRLKGSGSTVGVSCLCPGWVNTRIAESDRNRPEWAAPGPLNDPDPMAEAGFAFVKDQLASGMAPEELADLVHDAVTTERFWIFSDPTMVQLLRGRYGAILDGANPPVPEGFGD